MENKDIVELRMYLVSFSVKLFKLIWGLQKMVILLY